jgi:hypothetical protein
VDEIFSWKNPYVTAAAQVILFFMINFPRLIVPGVLFLIGSVPLAGGLLRASARPMLNRRAESARLCDRSRSFTLKVSHAPISVGVVVLNDPAAWRCTRPARSARWTSSPWTTIYPWQGRSLLVRSGRPGRKAL